MPYTSSTSQTVNDSTGEKPSRSPSPEPATMPTLAVMTRACRPQAPVSTCTGQRHSGAAGAQASR